jgi:hypothetical protein
VGITPKDYSTEVDVTQYSRQIKQRSKSFTMMSFDLKPLDKLTIPTIPDQLSNPTDETMAKLFSGRVDRPSARNLK